MENEERGITIRITHPSGKEFGETVSRVIQLRFEHPDWTQDKIGKEVGVSYSRVSKILRSKKVREALPVLAREAMKDLTPEATRAYADLIRQNMNLAVKEKAASRVLSENKVFDAPTVTVKHELALTDVRALQEKVQRAAILPSDVVDAELVDPGTTPPSTQDA
jgi:ParB-like chromosome segregation protein Spo0J